MGMKYLEIMENKKFKTNDELASYLNIGIESIRKRIQAAKVDKELIKFSPIVKGYLILTIVNWLKLKTAKIIVSSYGTHIRSWGRRQ